MEIYENASDQESVNKVYYEKSDHETDSEIDISDIEEAEEINSRCSQQNVFLGSWLILKVMMTVMKEMLEP